VLARKLAHHVADRVMLLGEVDRIVHALVALGGFGVIGAANDP
jgi:hypothetical protein